ncbi:DEAD/DEAH box helicase [Marinobacter sp.]|uniref:DEAD/DEAH box helicase n=1 Tax=Marinobacter sp. TaxID=50741 RepID=UPI003A944EE0
MHEVFEQIEKTLAGLKDFQQASVERVIENFFSEGHSERVLVADEVGLGKTIVAKGVIAKMLLRKINQSLEAGIECPRQPFRVTYICSNLALANENRKKLAVFSGDLAKKYVREPSFGRLVELAARERHGANGQLLEVCSLTPSTSFSLTNSDGNVWERHILFQCLMSHNALKPRRSVLDRLMRSEVKQRTWNTRERWFQGWYELNENLVDEFLSDLESEVSLSEDLADWLEVSGGSCIDALEAIGRRLSDCLPDDSEKTWNEVLGVLGGGASDVSSASFYRLRSELRTKLAKTCARHIRADLFILDEFQRFNSLLDMSADSENALIAQEVFKRDNPGKILLLSATPFKALSRIEDDEVEASHQEELRHLLTFLMNSDQKRLSEYEAARRELLATILRLRDDSFSVEDLSSAEKLRVERALADFIARTERGQIGENVDSVFRSERLDCAKYFSQSDINSFAAMTGLADTVDQVSQARHGHQLMEFYKSAPWALSFLGGYSFRDRLERNLKNAKVRSALGKSTLGWLPRERVANFRLNLLEDAPNAKVRGLVERIMSDRVEELLWVPPSAPHYPLHGPFADNLNFTKTLLFSAWAMVPRALSGLLSYEIERRLQKRKGGRSRYFVEDKKRSVPLIRLEGKNALTGWSLIYPSRVLASETLVRGDTTLEELLTQRSMQFGDRLRSLHQYESDGPDDHNWYAFAGMLLDHATGYSDELEDWLDWLRTELASSKDVGRRKHLDEIADSLEQLLDGQKTLGKMPNDLADYLALLSVSGPGVCALRMISGLYDVGSSAELKAAVGVAFGVLTLFNKPESISVIEKQSGTRLKNASQLSSVWKSRKILNYCAHGGFQAMIDEYGHLLKGSGLSAGEVSDRFAGVMGFQTSSVTFQYLGQMDGHRHLTPLNASLRCHFAVPLGIQSATDDKQQVRVEHIRDSFNSPFKPFMLNSTSIGQEGLDFHWYCNRVVHWNLPSNPIDIEQREGRVNRYKSLVVRRRATEHANSLGLDLDQPVDGGDYWETLFSEIDRHSENRTSDLTPYWHIPSGTAQIERLVPMMPMSREEARLDEALKILSLYRLAFGQPRQEELLGNLVRREFSEDDWEKIRSALVINLAPLNQIVPRNQPA